MREPTVRRMLLAGLVASMIPAAAYGQRADSGPLTICNASGARPVTGTFVYTTSAVAAAGGTQTFNVAVGSCAPRLFYPLGITVTVTESAPTGYVVSGIKLTPTPPDPTTTTVISSNTPAARSAVVTIGTGGATLTFTTTAGAGGGGGGGGSPCRCRTSSASLSRPRRPPSARRTAPSERCARSIPTSTTPTSSTARARNTERFSLRRAASISR